MSQPNHPIFIFSQDTLLMLSKTLPRAQDIDATTLTFSQFFTPNGTLLMAGNYQNTTLPPEFDWVPMRVALTLLSDEDRLLACKAKSLLRWERLHQYCGQCGGKTETKPHEFAKYCIPCDELFYPRLSPSVIMLVHRGDEILLGRKSTFGPEIYSCLAGFVEPGESAEMTVHREILEEVNVRVSELNYFGSQAWPFPDSFMLGFFAKYESGTLKIDEQELEDAQWFNINALPPIPSKVSIAHHLITHYIENYATISHTSFPLKD